MTLQEFIDKYGDKETFNYEITSEALLVTQKVETITKSSSGFNLPGYSQAKELELLLEGRVIKQQLNHIGKDAVVSAFRIETL